MSWVSLDDQFHHNLKVVTVGLAGAGLYARALSYCGDNLTDGYVPYAWSREVGTPALCKKLVTVGLWVAVSAGETFAYKIDGQDYVVEIAERGYLIPDYLAFNPTRAFIEHKRSELHKKRSEAGKKGAEARWGDGSTDGKQSGKADGKPMAKPMASAMAKQPFAIENGWQSDSKRMAPRPYPYEEQNPVTETALQDPAREPDQPGHGYGESLPDEDADAIARTLAAEQLA